ncbi:MAG: phage integrase N-terminal SAM-like domain-containing protein [Betaproteobacteria bacterium]|nr:phage integrase N-terminal SAM-like domain-containing protein [Betaproteobacteria bacterium]
MTTKLRREMDNAMVLRGFSPRTREWYLACVTSLAQHYDRSPDGLDAVEIQAYLLHLIGEKKLAYASVNQTVCAFRFLFDAVLGHKTLALENLFADAGLKGVEVKPIDVPTRFTSFDDCSGLGNSRNRCEVDDAQLSAPADVRSVANVMRDRSPADVVPLVR